MTSDADYTQYKMEFDVYHYDEDLATTRYKEHIVVYQEPMIYAEAEQNSRYPTDDSYNVFINTRNGNNTEFGGAHGLTGQNRNPNRYIIRATALLTDDFVIGDPRLREVNNALTGQTITTASTAVNTWARISQYNVYNDGKTQYSNNGGTYYYGTAYYRLQFYHPTEESVRTRYMLSPEYMIASSYGVTNAVTKENARRRCASYQEDGYPAGRWRLPTSAEIEYAVQLSAWKIIPILFGSEGSTTNYWSANGRVEVTYDANGNNGTVTVYENATYTNSYYVRCVYDNWYWTDKTTPVNRFYWGDKQTF